LPLDSPDDFVLVRLQVLATHRCRSGGHRVVDSALDAAQACIHFRLGDIVVARPVSCHMYSS